MLGAPGSGKGTQAKQLQDKFSIPQISTGDILRSMAKGTSPLAKQIQETQAAGKLVSDNILFEVVKERTEKDDCKDCFILDGYPRTLVQAKQLEKLASKEKIIKVFNIDVSDDLLLKRLTGRRNCSSCGQIYNIFFKPPIKENYCDICNVPLLHRSDDNLESIENRLQEYHKNTAPLIEFYKNQNCIFNVDGEKSASEVFEQLCTLL
jgi:adenylate kinase